MEHGKRRARLAPIIIFTALALALCAAFMSIPGGIFPPDVSASAEGESVYLGGMPVGIRLTSDGLVAVEYVGVVTKDGAKTPALDAGIQKGDLLIELNGVSLKEVSDIVKAIGDKTDPLPFKLLRNGKELTGEVTPVMDIVTMSPKIGLIVKNDLAGVGTVTFVKENGRMCTLGHKISEGDNDGAVYDKGSFYKCNILGVVKSEKNEPGSLKGVFNRNSEPVGNVDSNTDFGVYGTMTDNSFIEGRPKIEIGSISEVKPGKASVFTTLEGDEPKEYSVEIVKYETQAEPEIKGMVVRVTDPALTEKAGGIVQGMSGSPVVQNGKLVGAITHVFVNDPLYGYGIYASWMYLQ